MRTLIVLFVVAINAFFACEFRWAESCLCETFDKKKVWIPLHYGEQIEIAVSINCPDPQNVGISTLDIFSLN